ncbi:MAG: hypothetical protein BAJALOKI2v1_190012 [Promethearchaeota archaeon]|nr:MAG: hypothetical protein BAJALOKI2v1_190012 [Candidatus Lokiarchaeota archaeon]
MTQKKTKPSLSSSDGSSVKRSTRIENAPPDLYDPDEPRLGRRESEPHSSEITYIHDVLTTNFPDSRTVWDLHHYFIGEKPPLKGKKIDIQFDISFFQEFSIPHTLSSYDASEYDGRIPDMVINILSKSTWRADLSENVDTAKNLGIPIYVVFSPFKVTSKIYHPPFLRVYVLKDNKSYDQKELYDITLEQEEKISKDKIIDTSEILPFRLGLKKLDKFHKGEQSLFRLIFIHPSEEKILPTKLELIEREKEQAVREREQAEREKEQAEREKEQAVREREQAEREKEQAEREKEQAEEKVKELEKKLKNYHERYGELD